MRLPPSSYRYRDTVIEITAIATPLLRLPPSSYRYRDAVIQKGAVRREESNRNKSGGGAKSHALGGWFQRPRQHCG